MEGRGWRIEGQGGRCGSGSDEEPETGGGGRNAGGTTKCTGGTEEAGVGRGTLEGRAGLGMALAGGPHWFENRCDAADVIENESDREGNLSLRLRSLRGSS